MKTRDLLWVGGALALLAVQPNTVPVPQSAPPKTPPRRIPGPPASLPRQGDVITYIWDVPTGQIVVKTSESPDVHWGSPELAPEKVAPFQAMVARWASMIDDAGVDARVPSEELQAIMWAESGGDPNAVSKAGALGLLQVMPSNFPAGMTRAQMLDPRTNLRTGAKLYAAGRGDPVQAASWYNAGGQNGKPWTNAAWLQAGRNPAQTTRWGYAAEPGYLDTVVAAYNTAMKLKRVS